MFYQLASSLAPEWVSKSFPVIKFILLLLIFIAAIVMIVTILMQQSDSEGGTNVITGIKDSYYSQNKGMNREGRLKKLTIILAVFIAIAVVVFFVLSEIYGGSLWN